MIYDVHAHMDHFKEEELIEILKRAKEKNIGFIVSNSVDLASAKKVLELSKKFPMIKASLGYYPQDALSKEDNSRKADKFPDLKKLILENKKIVCAIGEIGMDFSTGTREKHNEQETLFRQQLDLARELNIPAIIHTRGAEREIVEILKDYPTIKKILHCFCGRTSLIKEAINIGCYFSIPCSMNRMENFKNTLMLSPKEKILTETDSPYLAPIKGETNEPAFIVETIKEISKVWNLPEEETEKIIEKNTKQIFK